MLAVILSMLAVITATSYPVSKKLYAVPNGSAENFGTDQPASPLPLLSDEESYSTPDTTTLETGRACGR
jgi:hypothetical protein